MISFAIFSDVKKMGFSFAVFFLKVALLDESRR